MFISQLIHFPSHSPLVAWKGSRRQPKTLGSCNRAGDLKEAPGSQLWISSTPAVAATWGVNQRIQDLSLSVSFMSPKYRFQILGLILSLSQNGWQLLLPWLLALASVTEPENTWGLSVSSNSFISLALLTEFKSKYNFLHQKIQPSLLQTSPSPWSFSAVLVLGLYLHQWLISNHPGRVDELS